MGASYVAILISCCLSKLIWTIGLIFIDLSWYLYVKVVKCQISDSFWAIGFNFPVSTAPVSMLNYKTILGCVPPLSFGDFASEVCGFQGRLDTLHRFVFSAVSASPKISSKTLYL